MIAFMAVIFMAPDFTQSIFAFICLFAGKANGGLIITGEFNLYQGPVLIASDHQVIKSSKLPFTW